MDAVIGKNAIVLLGAMFAALIAGYFAFTNLVASKENKISVNSGRSGLIRSEIRLRDTFHH